jgi:hypothetical protein
MIYKYLVEYFATLLHYQKQGGSDLNINIFKNLHNNSQHNSITNYFLKRKLSCNNGFTKVSETH